MPLIDLTIPAGALTDDAIAPLPDQLMRALLRAEGVDEEISARKSLSWVCVHELPPTRFFAGARPIAGRQPVFRVDVSIPAGALDTDHRAQFIAAATTLILEAAQQDPQDEVARAHVWVLFRDVLEGGWGAAGRVFGLAEIGAAVGAGEQRFAQAGLTTP